MSLSGNVFKVDIQIAKLVDLIYLLLKTSEILKLRWQKKCSLTYLRVVYDNEEASSWYLNESATLLKADSILGSLVIVAAALPSSLEFPMRLSSRVEFKLRSSLKLVNFKPMLLEMESD